MDEGIPNFSYVKLQVPLDSTLMKMDDPGNVEKLWKRADNWVNQEGFADLVKAAEFVRQGLPN